MIPLRILTLVVSSPSQPSVLVLEPVEDSPDGLARVLPIWIGPNEAAYVGMALEGARTKRPLTHDLFLDAITNLDARVDHVLIQEIEGHVYYSKLVLKQAGRLVELDARPTDAITLAVRQGAPLFITEEVLESGSFPYVFKRNHREESELEDFRSFLEDLSPEDFA